MTKTIISATEIAQNVDRFRFEFNSDQVSKKTPAELGRYIAGMSGTQQDLESFAGFVDALKGYDKADGEAFQAAFSQTREQRQ